MGSQTPASSTSSMINNYNCHINSSFYNIILKISSILGAVWQLELIMWLSGDMSFFLFTNSHWCWGSTFCLLALWFLHVLRTDCLCILYTGIYLNLTLTCLTRQPPKPFLVLIILMWNGCNPIVYNLFNPFSTRLLRIENTLFLPALLVIILRTFG